MASCSSERRSSRSSERIRTQRSSPWSGRRSSRRPWRTPSPSAASSSTSSSATRMRDARTSARSSSSSAIRRIRMDRSRTAVSASPSPSSAISKPPSAPTSDRSSSSPEMHWPRTSFATSSSCASSDRQDLALALLETLVLTLGAGVALFAAAGSLDWPMAWAYLAGFAGIGIAALWTASRELVAERSRLLAGGERDDVALSLAFFFLLYPATWLACGLDRRFGASPALPLPLEIAALALFLSGYALALWAMRVNAFFSTMVRIQRERGHRVIDRGPYRFVRHPGYAGAVVAHL